MIRVTHLMAFSEDGSTAVFSGAENHLFVLMEAQKKLGLDVELILLVYQKGPVLENKIDELKGKGIHVRCFEVPKRGPFKMLRSSFLLREYLKDHRDNIIHTHLDHADLAGKLAAWYAGCKYVVSTFHNDEPYYNETIWKLRLKFLDRLSRKQIVISRSIYALLVDRVKIGASKLELVYYGIDPPSIRDPRAVIREHYHIPQSAYVVGFVGRLAPQKNLYVFLQAMAKLPALLGVIVGDGSHRQEYENYVQHNHILNIRFLGYQPEGRELISSFDLFCLPSKWEGFGMVVLEAMLAKTPVVGSRAGAIPELLEDGKCGLLFDPKFPDDLFNKILYAFNNPEVVESYRQLAYERAVQTFTVGSMAQKTLKIYRDIIS